MPNLFKAVLKEGYEPGDYLLLDDQGEDVAVGGNSDFWMENEPEYHAHIDETGPWLIVKVIEVHHASTE